MTIFGFYGALRMFLLPAGFALVLVLVVLQFAYQQNARETEFKKKFGADWEQHYVEKHGPLRENRQKVAVGVGSIFVIGGLAFFIYKQFVPVKAPRRRY